jgi:ABC-type nitrate/sulfonate/bicarbonate transport system permease component
MFALGCWEAIPLVFDVKEYILPRFSAVVGSITRDWVLVNRNIQPTIQQAVGGLAIGGGIGFCLGVLVAEYRNLERSIFPYIVASNAVPVVAMAPIVNMWLGYGYTSKAVVAAFLCFFPMAISTFRGLKNVAEEYRELYRLMGVGKLRFLLSFSLRNAAPQIFSGLRLSATYSVVGSIVAEFIGADRGIGFAIVQSSYTLNSPRLFGYLVVACALGLCFYGLVAVVEWVFFPEVRYSGTR